MKLRNLNYAFVIVALLVLFQVLLATANAQLVRLGRYGCAVAPDGRADAEEFDLKRILVRTYDPNLDGAILNDMGNLNQIFQVSVGVYYPNDDKSDAFFSPSGEVGRNVQVDLLTRDDVDPNRKLTGFIFISKSFLEREFRQNFGSRMSVPAILAHEYAHALQYRKGFSLGKGIRQELQADFMAGWYIAYRCRCIGPQDVNVAFHSLYRKGDTRAFFDPDHHGTSVDRFNMAVHGFNYFNRVSMRFPNGAGAAAADDAYNYSFNMVKSW